MRFALTGRYLGTRTTLTWTDGNVSGDNEMIPRLLRIEADAMVSNGLGIRFANVDILPNAWEDPLSFLVYMEQEGFDIGIESSEGEIPQLTSVPEGTIP